MDWKLACTTGSNMVETCDVTVSSEQHFSFCSTAQYSDQTMDIEGFLQEWDEDDLAELLEDNNSSRLKPA